MIILEASLPGPWARVNAAGRVRHELCKSGVEEEEETDGLVFHMLVGQQVSVTETVCLHFGRYIY